MLELIRFYSSPQQYVKNTTNFTEFVAQARDQAMLGSIYYHLHTVAPDVKFPSDVERHLISGKVYADKHHVGCFQELKELMGDLQTSSLYIVFVKGVAYKLRGLKFAQGRTFSDIDLLVPQSQFNDAVNALKNIGFVETTLNDYDRNYYLKWSHQYPPLFHYLRGTGVDLHHGIIPITSKTRISTDDYIQTSVQIAGMPFYLPSDAYLFIHAVVHLFLQEEHHKIAKDLCELNELGRELSFNPGWSDDLWCAAEKSGTTEVVYIALTVLQHLFEHDWAVQVLQKFFGKKPTYIRLCWHKSILTRLLEPTTGLAYQFAALSWYCRGHLHKMGFFRLLRHSLTKYWLTRQLQKNLTAEQRLADVQSKPKDAGMVE
jgi:hypothetical protein